jgi:pyruvate/2-oxoglutarate dehydrogenase complex dihydrolipoamide acyltransferase (E2) component
VAVTVITIPRAGQNITEATLVEWLVGDGEVVTAGDDIYRIETDKAEMDVEAPVSGTLRQTGLVGETYDVGTPIGEIID